MQKDPTFYLFREIIDGTALKQTLSENCTSTFQKTYAGLQEITIPDKNSFSEIRNSENMNLSFSEQENVDSENDISENGKPSFRIPYKSIRQTFLFVLFAVVA